MRFLVIQLARFGDLVQTGRLVRSLQKEGETHLCVDHSLVDLAHLLYPDCITHGITAHAESKNLDADLFIALVSQNKASCAELASIKADAIYNLNFTGMNFALASLFPPEKVHGYAMHNGQPIRDRWMTFLLRWTENRRTSPLNLMDFWGLLADHPLSPQAVHPVAQSGGRGIGVVLSGQQSRRSLPSEVLAPMLTALFEGLGGAPVFLFGTRTERKLSRQLEELLPGSLLAQTHNLTGRTTWKELYDAIKDLDLLLTPDTGTMHLAAHLGVPVFGTFLSSAWGWETGPYGAGHRIWQSVRSCAPCRELDTCANVFCLDAFRKPAFLRALCHEAANLAQRNVLGKAELPPDLHYGISSFDDLGLIWKNPNPSLQENQAENPFQEYGEKRLTLRHIVAEYLAAQGKIDPVPLTSLSSAENFYDEIDCVLPERV